MSNQSTDVEGNCTRKAHPERERERERERENRGCAGEMPSRQSRQKDEGRRVKASRLESSRLPRRRQPLALFCGPIGQDTCCLLHHFSSFPFEARFRLCERRDLPPICSVMKQSGTLGIKGKGKTGKVCTFARSTLWSKEHQNSRTVKQQKTVETPLPLPLLLSLPLPFLSLCNFG